MNKGDVCLVEFGSSNRHEQRGFRPAIIMSKEITNMILVIPLTTKMEALNYKFSLEVEPSNKSQKFAKIARQPAIFETRILASSHICFLPTLKCGVSNLETNGISNKSVAMLFQLRSIDKKRVTKKIGTIEKELIEQIDLNIKEIMGLRGENG